MSYRQIKFAGRYSMLDFGVYIGPELDTDTRREKARPRNMREKIPFMNGSYDFTRLSGKVIFDDQKLYYTFIISEKTKELVAEKADKLDEWLSSDSDELYDNAYPGWKFVGVSYEGMSEIQYYSYNENKGRVTVEFTAAPYMQTTTGLLINCLTFTPNAAATKYLFAQYHAISATATTQYYLSRLTTNGTDSLPNAEITFENVQVSQAQSMKVAVCTITGSAPKWYLMPKTMGSTAVSVWSVTNGATIREDDDYYYIYQNTGSSVAIYIEGFNYSTSTEAAVEAAILHAAWLYPDNMQSFEAATIPSTNDMRIISEGDPTITINGETSDISHFALAVGDILTVSNAKSEPCKLQYCTIKERR